MRRLFANIGAEEGTGEDATVRHPGAAAAAATWAATFGAGVELERGFAALAEPGPAEPGYPWMAAPGLWAWFNDDAAADAARAHGLALCGATPEVTARVHDKAFAVGLARREGLGEPADFDAIRVLTPEQLAEPRAVADIIAAAAAHWPACARGRFVLKPRFGTSGRGRFAGNVDALDPEALASACVRLAARRGAVLEPWFDRSTDLSTLLHVENDGALLVLGSAELLVTPSGVYRGHRGQIDARGRPSSNDSADESVREAAVAVAQAASTAGYRGPCGVDAFTYRGPEGETRLRPVVEFNARFTMGIVALASMRQRRAAIREQTGLRGGQLRSFAFVLDASRVKSPPNARLAGGAALWFGAQLPAL